MLVAEQAIDLAGWAATLDAQGQATDMKDFVNCVDSPGVPHAVIVDCTASAAVAEHYPGWLARGIHVITPNKKANSASQEFYRQLRSTARGRRTHYLYEATVGAGLPVIQTLRDLQNEFQRHTGVRDYSATDGVSPGICHQVAREDFVDQNTLAFRDI